MCLQPVSSKMDDEEIDKPIDCPDGHYYKNSQENASFEFDPKLSGDGSDPDELVIMMVVEDEGGNGEEENEDGQKSEYGENDGVIMMMEKEINLYQSHTLPLRCLNDTKDATFECQSKLKQRMQTFSMVQTCVKKPVWRTHCDLCMIYLYPLIDMERTGVVDNVKPKRCSNSEPWVNCQSNRSGIPQKFKKNVNHEFQPSTDEHEGLLIVPQQPMYFTECDACREYRARPDESRCITCGCWKQEHYFLLKGGKKFSQNCTLCRGRKNKTRGRLSHQSYLRSRIRTVRRGAKKRKHSISMTDEQLACVVQRRCIYCGYSNDYGFSGWDRIDSKKGYHSENVVPCCSRCNTAKCILSIKIFVERMYHYAHHHSRSKDVPNISFPSAFTDPRV